MEPILTVENLTKRYGAKPALKNISLVLESGRIMGLMGPNGSGKTTFLKVVAGLQKANGGKVCVCGNPVGIESKKYVSFLPDRNIMPKWMTALDAFDYYRDYFDDFDMRKALDMLDFVRLEKNVPVSQMAKGMIEKLNLTLCFSRKAKLFLLDEPLGGVDPVARERIVSAIVNTYNPSSSIIVSTHLVHDIEHMFNDVCFIGKGEIVLYEDASVLKSGRGMDIDELYIDTFKEM
ncbi:ABC transporter ATP-binding protein [Treponema sp. Marseille-Q4132]|uniref:ABC transporter ATP-binding protein n=1 Tax=Treponema sp. Marseille-Q4132 TaxID=2766701 RepID=UPI001652F697|nr:ABC transporter ATP-binding protein [Treponema sp. Marseille-Q4132]QNL96139.1 ABC transporter ATP-binding protein [Treponema sp. Marseille-Q4132]